MEAVGVICTLAVVGFIVWRILEARKAPKGDRTGGTPDKQYPPSKEK